VNEQDVETDQEFALHITNKVLNSKPGAAFEPSLENTPQTDVKEVENKKDPVVKGSAESVDKNREETRKKELEDAAMKDESNKDYEDNTGEDKAHGLQNTEGNRAEQDHATQNYAGDHEKHTTEKAVVEILLVSERYNHESTDLAEERKATLEDHTDTLLWNHLKYKETVLPGGLGHTQIIKNRLHDLFTVN